MKLKDFIQELDSNERLDLENQAKMIELSFKELGEATIKQVYAHLNSVSGIYPSGRVEAVAHDLLVAGKLKQGDNGLFLFR